MIFASRQPHARLAPLLAGGLIGWASPVATPPCRELPFPGLPLIISFGERFELTSTRRARREVLTVGSFVAGLDDWFTESVSPAGSCAIQVNFTPIGARLILGLPLESVTQQVITLEGLLGAEGVRLEHQLGAEDHWERRFDLLESWLLGRLDRASRLTHEVRWIWQQLDASRGTASIGQLGDTLGWSRQRLVTTVRRELGMSPKMLARIVRFHTMTQRVRSGRARNWSALAVECGYHDQAHLIRDTRAFAGCTPTELPGHLLPLPA